VRRAISLLFDTFTATGSAFAVVRAFRQAQLTFPARHRGGPRAGELYFKALTHDQVLKILHNPCYAGAYCYGRARHTTDLDGHHHTLIKPAEDWTVLLPDHHPGYITWPRYQANLQVLAANAAARGDNRTAGPAREGPALLQGLIVCGRCGRRMTVRYHTRADSTIVPDYVCQNDGISNAAPICQHLPGAVLDTAVAGLLLATLTPLALEVALTVTGELAAQAGHADALRAAHVQRAQHAADQARRRYLAVDPGNRLVADALEADWNTRLRELATARDDYATARSATAVLDDQQRARIRALATDFPALWHDPATPMRERKRLIRLLITDVTLTRGDHAITAAVRLPGGQHHTLNLPIPLNAWQQRKTPQPVIEQIDQLLGSHTYSQVACILNQRGLTSGDSKPWDAGRVRAHCFTRHIPSRWQRLRDTGMLTLGEAARQLHAHPSSIKRWYRLGLITGHLADDRGTCLYHPGQARPGPALVEAAGKALGDTHRSGRSHHPGLGGPLQPPRNVSTPRDNHISDTT